MYNSYIADTVIALVVAAVAVGTIIHVSKPYPADTSFVCYTDDALSERHFGVIDYAHYKNGVWRLYYAEGGGAFYRQQPGEACTIESATTDIRLK